MTDIALKSMQKEMRKVSKTVKIYESEEKKVLKYIALVVRCIGDIAWVYFYTFVFTMFVVGYAFLSGNGEFASAAEVGDLVHSIFCIVVTMAILFAGCRYVFYQGWNLPIPEMLFSHSDVFWLSCVSLIGRQLSYPGDPDRIGNLTVISALVWGVSELVGFMIARARGEVVVLQRETKGDARMTKEGGKSDL